MDDDGHIENKVVVGPGPERWPGAPDRRPVQTEALQEISAAEERRQERQRHVLRLKVISAVQMAAVRFSDDEIRAMVEQAFQNARTRNDY